MRLPRILSDLHINQFFAEDQSQDDLFLNASYSEFVICTPSVISLEMLAMKIPFISIMTAQDQWYYQKKYREHGIPTNNSSFKELKEFILNPQKPTISVDVNYVYKLASTILCAERER